MRYRLAFFIAFFQLICSCNESSESTKKNMDSVVVLPSKRDLGKVESSDLITLNFEIINNSNKDIKIVSKAKSCGCTNFVLPSDKLKAKSHTVVNVDFDPTKVSGDFEKSVFFRLDNGKILLFKFSGTVV